MIPLESRFARHPWMKSALAWRMLITPPTDSRTSGVPYPLQQYAGEVRSLGSKFRSTKMGWATRPVFFVHRAAGGGWGVQANGCIWRPGGAWHVADRCHRSVAETFPERPAVVDAADNLLGRRLLRLVATYAGHLAHTRGRMCRAFATHPRSSWPPTSPPWRRAEPAAHQRATARQPARPSLRDCNCTAILCQTPEARLRLSSLCSPPEAPVAWLEAAAEPMSPLAMAGCVTASCSHGERRLPKRSSPREPGLHR